MAAKGFVYFFVGGLTLASALKIGGSVSGKSGVVDFLQNQPFGNLLVILLSIGLFGFVCWRTIQAIKNPEDKSFAHRFAYSISGLFYALFAGSILYNSFFSASQSGGGKTSVLSELMQSTLGSIMIGAIALGLLVKAVFQFKNVFGSDFRENLKNSKLKQKAQKTIKTLGIIGYSARGVVILIITFLLTKALFTKNSSSAGGTKEAFQLLDQSTSSTISLIIISTGLAFYGLYMIAKAKYKAMPSL